MLRKNNHFNKIFICKFLILIIVLVLFCTKKSFSGTDILYGDVDGDAKKEKIIINYDSRKVTDLIILHDNKVLYRYDKFKNSPFSYAKLINFKGSSTTRDILFIVVGECDSYMHILNYKTIEVNNRIFEIKEFVGQIESCY